MLSGVTEAEALLAKLAAEESIDGVAATELLDRIEELHATLGALRSPIRPLHGDAHLNNVLNTAGRARCGTTGRTRASARSGGTRRA